METVTDWVADLLGIDPSSCIVTVREVARRSAKRSALQQAGKWAVDVRIIASDIEEATKASQLLSETPPSNVASDLSKRGIPVVAETFTVKEVAVVEPEIETPEPVDDPEGAVETGTTDPEVSYGVQAGLDWPWALGICLWLCEMLL